VPSPLASSSSQTTVKASQSLSQSSIPQPPSSKKGKGKDASHSSHEEAQDEGESAMWVDLYEPQTEVRLCVLAPTCSLSLTLG